MANNGSPITQITENTTLFQQENFTTANRGSNSVVFKQLKLQLRGHIIDIDVETLMLFPESLTLNIFSDGLSLHQLSNQPLSPAVAEKVHLLDFNPDYFQYIKTFFEQSRQLSTKQKVISETNYTLDDCRHSTTIPSSPDYTLSSAPDTSKQFIIVLREEMDFFVLPQSANTIRANDDNTRRQETGKNIQHLKTQAGQRLVEENNIFASLTKNIEKENNNAERHLISVLFEAGFNHEDQWAYRGLEPKRTCVSSLSLSRLDTHKSHRDTDIAKQLMMFWKKPARKCWWDSEQIDLNNHLVRLWKRRIFWLELVII